MPTDTPLPVPSEIASPELEAAFLEGYYMAGVVNRHLENVGIMRIGEKRRQHPVVLWPELVMEFSAVLRLVSWLDSGLYDLLTDNERSSLLMALEDGSARFNTGLQPIQEGEELPPLTCRVLDICLKRLASSGREELKVDVLVDDSEISDDAMLNELADYLWQHRAQGYQLTES